MALLNFLPFFARPLARCFRCHNKKTKDDKRGVPVHTHTHTHSERRWKAPGVLAYWTLRWLTMSGGGKNHRDVKPHDNIAPPGEPLNWALKRPESKKKNNKWNKKNNNKRNAEHWKNMNKKNGCSFDGGVSLNIINSGTECYTIKLFVCILKLVCSFHLAISS